MTYEKVIRWPKPKMSKLGFFLPFEDGVRDGLLYGGHQDTKSWEKSIDY